MFDGALEVSLRVVIALLPLMLATGCDKQSAPAPQANLSDAAPQPEAAGALDITQRGKPAPTVSFKSPDGKAVTLAAFRGTPVLVNLWATWCGPCVKEMPSLDRLAAKTQGRLTVLTVSQDTQGVAVVAPWWAPRGFTTIKPYLDEKADLGFAFETGSLPTTVLYDKDGKEVWRIVGGMDWEGPRANTLLSEVIG